MTAPIRPSVQAIFERICTDIELYLPGAAARAPESLLSTLAAAEAGVAHELYGYLEYLALQLLPDTADELFLARWAEILNVPRLDGELLPAWRSRVIARLQERSRIGDADDYRRWVMAASPSVKNAWVRGSVDLGLVEIFVVLNGDNPTPTESILASIQQQLDRVRNVAADVRVLAPASLVIPLVISGVSDLAVRAAITERVTALFAGKQYISAKLLVAEIHAVIQTITLSYSLLSPLNDVTAAYNELILLGGVTWVA